MKKQTKQNGLTVAYFPFQLILEMVLMPFIIVVFAWWRARELSFDDVYMTEDNPSVNQNGPTMQRKKNHCWLMRFVNPWA